MSPILIVPIAFLALIFPPLLIPVGIFWLMCRIENKRIQKFILRNGKFIRAHDFINARIKNYTAFDTETTGVDHNVDKIIEIAAVKVRFGIPIARFSMLVNPGMHIPAAATNVNHITDRMVRHARSEEHVLRKFNKFVGADILIAHNSSKFDIPLLKKAYTSHDLGHVNAFTDSLWMARTYLKGLENYKLGTCCRRIGYTPRIAHRALADSYSVYKLVEACRKISKETTLT